MAGFIGSISALSSSHGPRSEIWQPAYMQFVIIFTGRTDGLLESFDNSILLALMKP